MIDEKTHTYPYSIKMLQECKQEVKQEHKELIFLHFSELYSIMKIDGHIIEDIYNRLGIYAWYKLRHAYS